MAANVQAGKTNTQTIGTTKVVQQKLVRPTARNINQSTDTNKVRTERVETVVMNEGPSTGWVIALILWSILLWQLPSPNSMGEWVNRWVFRNGR